MKPFKIYGDNIEQGALDQFYSAMEQDFVVRGALMPDAHQGYSLPIGGVVATDNFVLPSWVGYDIGCGMCAVPTTFDSDEIWLNARNITNSIYEAVPVGFRHNDRALNPKRTLPHSTAAMADIFADKGGFRQLGTLGGGNHFIEVGADVDERVWIIVHSGSRGIGHGCAAHYMRAASPTGKATEGHFGFYADSQDGEDYLQDQEFCLQFALENRSAIINRVENVLTQYTEGNARYNCLINRNHNHAELKDGMYIHRKGATHAEAGMPGVIPGNMRDGSFIVKGKGNPDALWSSSHGAGRVLGRKVAKQTLLLEDFENAMVGITARVEQDCIDESPMAYKDIFEVMAAQSEMVSTVAHVRPILNVKG